MPLDRFNRMVVEYKRLFAAQTIAAAGSATSADFLDVSTVDGSFALYLTLTGSGTAAVDLYCSAFEADFIAPVGVYSLLTGATALGGVDANGKFCVPFDSPVAKFLKIRVRETGGANTITVTLDLVIR